MLDYLDDEDDNSIVGFSISKKALCKLSKGKTTIFDIDFIYQNIKNYFDNPQIIC